MIHLVLSAYPTSVILQNEDSDIVVSPQFYSEVTVLGMKRWYIGHSTEIHQNENISVQQLREDAQKYGYKMDMYGSAFMEEWLALINKAKG